jgi:hypothetical protein
MPFVLRDCASNFTSEIKTRRKNKTNIQYNIKTRKMSKLQKIIKDIVKQQLEFAEKRNQRDDKEFIRQLTYKQLIITEDGVGRH